MVTLTQSDLDASVQVRGCEAIKAVTGPENRPRVAKELVEVRWPPVALWVHEHRGDDLVENFVRQPKNLRCGRFGRHC